MAERRMFTKKIVDSDAFLDMPLSTQSLYFHLNMRADDDGFVNNPKKIQRMIGASEDDLKLLIAKRLLLVFENGVIVIKHWRMHNTLRKDRYNPTQYQEQLQELIIKDNGSYTEKPLEIPVQQDGNQMATTWQPNGNHLATQVSLGKDSIGKDSIGKGRLVDEEEPQPPLIYQQIVDKFNEICISFPKVVKITKSINESIRSCLETYSQEELITVFEKAEQSNFLKGDNNHNWQADFEWLIKDDNIAKALNGKYDNNRQFNQEPTNNQSSNRFNNFNQREYSKEEMDDLEKKLLSR